MSNKQSGLGITSFIFGIISFLLSPCLGIGILPGILSIIFGIVILCQKDVRKEFAVIGTVLSGIAIISSICMLLFPPFFNGFMKGISNSNENVNVSEDGMEFDYRDCHVKYIKHDVIDKNGYSEIVVYYEFTNNSNQDMEFDDLDIKYSAYQNGIKIDKSYDKSDNNRKKIQSNGGKIEVYESFELENKKDDVTIELKTRNDKIITTLELNLEIEEASTVTEENEIVEEKQEENNIDFSLLSEEEYKDMCQELWHDDIFFSEENLEGKYVKLELFVGEWRYYDFTALQLEQVKEFLNKYDLKRDFYMCSVKRDEVTASYFGGELRLYIPNEIEMTINTGDHITVWGEIVRYGENYETGYNECYLVPKYIENKG